MISSEWIPSMRSSAVPEFPHFVRLRLDHEICVDAALKGMSVSSDFLFSSLWSWNTHGGMDLSNHHDNLVIAFQDYLTNQHFYTFIGLEDTVRTANDLLHFNIGRPGVSQMLKLIPEDMAKQLLRDPRLVVIEDVDNHDYIYDLSHLASYSGHRFQSKRWQVNVFAREQRPRVSHLDLDEPRTWVQIRQLMNSWFSERKHSLGAANCFVSLRRFRRLFHTQRFLALGVYVGERMVAFSVTELTNSDCCMALYEHADTNCFGVYPFLRQTTARQLLAMGFQRLNFQQDLGVSGLRKSKQSYYPTSLLRKYIVHLKDHPEGLSP